MLFNWCWVLQQCSTCLWWSSLYVAYRPCHLNVPRCAFPKSLKSILQSWILFLDTETLSFKKNLRAYVKVTTIIMYVCVNIWVKHYHGATSIYESLMSFPAPQYACRTWTICVYGLTLYFMLKIEANRRYILCL